MLSISGSLKHRIFILVPGLLAAALAFWYLAIHAQVIPRRTLRIGFEQVPPVQIRTERGFSGLTVDIVREAAKRAGVSLQWIETGMSSEESLRRGLVDLWPIMVDLPERRKVVHITPSWLHTSHMLVLRTDMEAPEARFAGRIGLVGMPVQTRLLRREFPDAQLIRFSEAGEIVQEVCRGTIHAGFLEDRAALTALRQKPPECAGQDIHVHPLPHLTVPLGVGSTFEAAGAADRIRDEIGDMFRDGTFASTIAKYSYYGLDETWDTYALMEKMERARWAGWVIGLLAVGLTLALCQTFALRQRKRTESTLRESERRFRSIFQQAGVGVAQVSLDGKIELANQWYYEVVGYSQEDLTGRETEEITHREDLQGEARMLPLLLAGKIPSFSVEKRYVRKDGELVWVTMSKSLVREVDGQPKCLIVVLQDITKRKEAERELRQSERHALERAAELQAIMDAAPAILIANDPECGHISGNRMAHSLLRQQPGTNFSMSAPEGERPVNLRLLREGIEIPAQELPIHRAARSGQPVQNWETEVRFKDGDSIFLLGNAEPMLDHDGRPQGAVAVLNDITQRKQLEAALLERELRYKEVFDNFSECIFVLDVAEDGRFKIAWLNPAEEKATGLSNEHVTGKFIDDVLPEDVAERVM